MGYVSITGFRTRSALHAPAFWLHAFRSMAQARAAEGCLSAEARSIEGVHHTVTFWRDEAAMRAFLGAGAHGRAMRAFRALGGGATLGYAADSAPDWAEARARWLREAKEV